jgi:nucleotide-binding universal stress UspA family protein
LVLGFWLGSKEVAMSATTTRSGILVGYDGSPHSARALEWAVLEARRHDAPLVLCTAVPQNAPDSRLYGNWVPEEKHLAAAEQLLRAAGDHVAETAADVPITCTTAMDQPARALVDRADRAEMVVVGSRGHGGLASMLLGSVSLYVAAHAPCPVVVVPARDASNPTHLRDIVVVGYDGSVQAEAAMAFAVTEAALRGAELEVIHSWHDPYALMGYPIAAAPGLFERREKQARDLVMQAIEPWAAKYPDLQVAPSFTHEPATAFLVRRSAFADLVVVGSHGHRPFTGMLLGSVSNAVAHAARCPVAIVRART